MPTPICLVGIGKIAKDQHAPAIAASNDWDLAATVSRAGSVDGAPAYTDFAKMLEERPDIPVISLCLPTVPRFEYAKMAIIAGRHVMLEKPPGATIAEVQELERLAADAGVSLFATWHSRMACGVPRAKDWLADRVVETAHIVWKEDVRRWHPSQEWVFEPGGMGVFDPGINALSILTEILPTPVFLRSARLDYPVNRQTPIAAELEFSGGVTADFDWRQEGPQIWQITVSTSDGDLVLDQGGSALTLAEKSVDVGPNREYPSLYARMAELVALGQSDVDLSPMIHVSDALTLGRRSIVEPFLF